MLTIHHLNNSRSHRIVWLCEELGMDYQLVKHQRDPQTQRSPESLTAVHPLGKAPTIEHKGQVDPDLRALMGNRIYGCDDCLAVCPWNKFASAAAANRAFLPRAELTAPRLAELLALDDGGFRALFSGSPIKRIGRDRFVRNCLYAAGNSDDPALLPQVRALLGDPDEAVADAARWALERLA